MSHSEYLISSPLVAVTDQHCTAPRSGHGDERPVSSHEIVFVRRGVFVIHRGREQRVADPAQVIFFNAGDEVSFSHPQEGGDDSTVLEFTTDAVLDVLARRDPSVLDRGVAPLVLDAVCAAPDLLLRLHGLRRALRVASTCGDLRTMAAEDEALHLLDRVVTAVRLDEKLHPRRARAARPGEHRDLVEHAKFLLARAPGKPHALTELARATNTSPFHLARTFRERVGLPLHQYLLRIRLSTALWRLSEGEEHLSTLALDLGFNSHSHFTSAFRRVFGVPPSAARRAMEAAGEPELGPTTLSGQRSVPELWGLRAFAEANARCHCACA
jgi:AraC family transcriptional regulator